MKAFSILMVWFVLCGLIWVVFCICRIQKEINEVDKHLKEMGEICRRINGKDDGR